MDDEAYNFNNSYARNSGFGVKRKGIDKSQRPPHEIICRKFCCNKEGVKIRPNRVSFIASTKLGETCS